MPKIAAKIAISRTTRRLRKQRATNWSIIEPHRAFHHYPFARLDPGFDGNHGTFLIGDLDIPAFESPLRRLDEDVGSVVGQDQRRRGHHQPRYRRSEKSRVSEHIRL